MSEREKSPEERGYVRMSGPGDVYIHGNLIGTIIQGFGRADVFNVDLKEALEEGLITPDGVVTHGGKKELKGKKENEVIPRRKDYIFSEEKKYISSSPSTQIPVRVDEVKDVPYHDPENNGVARNVIKRLMDNIEAREAKRESEKDPVDSPRYDPSQEEKKEIDNIQFLLEKHLIEKNPKFGTELEEGDPKTEYILTQMGELMMKGGYDGPELAEQKPKKKGSETNPNLGKTIRDIFFGLEPNLENYEKFEMKKTDDGFYVVKIIFGKRRKVSRKIDISFLNNLDSEEKKLAYIREELVKLLKKKEDDVESNY